MNEKNISDMTFEEALSELEKIVKKIDSEQETLDRVIEDFERGSRLKEHCENKLEEAKLKIEKIVKKDGKISLDFIEESGIK